MVATSTKNTSAGTSSKIEASGGAATAKVVPELKRLNARSVVLSTLLGTQPPRMPAQRLVRVGELFGIREGTIRTALTRMVQSGDLHTDERSWYSLSEDLQARQRRQSSSVVGQSELWNGSWTVAVVTTEESSPRDRSALRNQLRLLRFAEQRPGVWVRPDNLGVEWRVLVNTHLGASCFLYSATPGGRDLDLVDNLWDLESWSRTARALRKEMATMLAGLRDSEVELLRPGFVISAAVLRHLQRDPLLPVELLDRRWEGRSLRRDYQVFDELYRQLLATW